MNSVSLPDTVSDGVSVGNADDVSRLDRVPFLEPSTVRDPDRDRVPDTESARDSIAQRLSDAITERVVVPHAIADHDSLRIPWWTHAVRRHAVSQRACVNRRRLLRSHELICVVRCELSFCGS